MEAFIQTHSGIRVSIMDPDPEHIKIEDIAWALAHQCRFGGHCKKFYSVAEHSLLVASYLPREIRLEALLHDAAEAYILDVPSPLKALLLNYKMIEKDFESAIHVALGLKKLSANEKKVIKAADRVALATEADALMRDTSDWEILQGFNPQGKILGYDPYQAYTIFIEKFTDYTAEREYWEQSKYIFDALAQFLVVAGKGSK